MPRKTRSTKASKAKKAKADKEAKEAKEAQEAQEALEAAQAQDGDGDVDMTDADGGGDAAEEETAADEGDSKGKDKDGEDGEDDNDDKDGDGDTAMTDTAAAAAAATEGGDETEDTDMTPATTTTTTTTTSSSSSSSTKKKKGKGKASAEVDDDNRDSEQGGDGGGDGAELAAEVAASGAEASVAEKAEAASAASATASVSEGLDVAVPGIQQSHQSTTSTSGPSSQSTVVSGSANLPPGVLNAAGRAAEAALEEDKYDQEAWTTILSSISSKSIEVVRPAYEAAVATFPSASLIWRDYIAHELRAKNYRNVERLFIRCLTRVPNVDLWLQYVRYVREVKTAQFRANTEDSAAASVTYDLVTAAFEFALDHVGIDLHAARLWNDYLDFLEGDRTKDEGLKVSIIRRVYKRAVLTPMTGIKAMWERYCNFERGQSPHLADGILRTQAPTYNLAGTLMRQQADAMRRIDRRRFPSPPSTTGDCMKQVAEWRKYLEWELKDPARLADEQYLRRVMFAYNQCLLSLYFHADVWYDACAFLVEKKQPAAATMMFKRAMEALPTNHLLALAYCDFQEECNNHDEARRVYDSVTSGAGAANASVWVHYMRFAQRTEGMAAARRVFSRARKVPGISYHIYVAAALLEYHVNKDATVATRIFEFGLRKFLTDPAYVLAYVDFLTHRQDENNTRGLFERALNKIPTESAAEVWRHFLAFEYACGDLSSIKRVETRLADALPEVTVKGALRLVHRYQAYGSFPCSATDIDYLYLSAHPSAVPRTVTDADRRRAAAAKGPKPDVSRMEPFQPTGGVRDTMPEWLNNFVKELPSSSTFVGPLVKLDVLFEAILMCRVEPAPKEQAMAVARRGVKRGIDEVGDDDDAYGLVNMTDSQYHTPPENDVFRKRLTRKMQRRK